MIEKPEKPEKKERKIVVITVKNYAGVLSRVTSLLRRRTFNIDSLTVAKTENPEISRITLQLEPNINAEQVAKQLNKLIDVIKVFDVTHKTDILHETAFIRVYVSEEDQKKLRDIAENFQTKVVSQVPDNIVFKISDDPDQIRECLDALKVFGKHEIVRSGPTAIYL